MDNLAIKTARLSLRQFGESGVQVGRESERQLYGFHDTSIHHIDTRQASNYTGVISVSFQFHPTGVACAAQPPTRTVPAPTE